MSLQSELPASGVFALRVIGSLSNADNSPPVTAKWPFQMKIIEPMVAQLFGNDAVRFR